MTTYILYHADADGRFAGWAARRYFLENGCTDLVMHEVQYNQPFPVLYSDLKTEDVVHILDFSYRREICEQINDRVGQLIILDHHKTAEKELEGLHYATFDKTKSGALLAWEYYFPEKRVPWVCRLVNDRDLWKFEEGDDTRGFAAYLHVKNIKSDWDKWEAFVENEMLLMEFIREGRNFLEVERAIVKNFCENKRNICYFEIEINGVSRKVAFYEGMNILHSETAEYLYTNKDIDFTMEWRMKDFDVMVFSLRSNKIDVSEIAHAFGGGGHEAAAGFSKTAIDGLKFVSDLYKVIEGKDTISISTE